MNMTYKLNDLTEEIFGHLCNVALHKCSDKSEKKRAGCGVLIKNFVSDLFKMPKKTSSSREQDMASSDEEYEEYDMSDVSFYDEEVDEFRLEDLTHYEHASMHQNDLWLHQPYTGTDMGGFGGMSSSMSMASAGMTSYGSYDMPSSYSAPSSVGYQPFDMYGSSMSESATEGDMPLPSDPLASMSGMLPAVESSSFDHFSSPTTSVQSSFFPGDDYFLSNVGPEPIFTDIIPEPLSHEDTHELTDLDVATGESHANKNKRRSTELFDDFTGSFQKRIKI